MNQRSTIRWEAVPWDLHERSVGQLFDDGLLTQGRELICRAWRSVARLKGSPVSFHDSYRYLWQVNNKIARKSQGKDLPRYEWDMISFAKHFCCPRAANHYPCGSGWTTSLWIFHHWSTLGPSHGSALTERWFNGKEGVQHSWMHERPELVFSLRDYWSFIIHSCFLFLSLINATIRSNPFKPSFPLLFDRWGMTVRTLLWSGIILWRWIECYPPVVHHSLSSFSIRLSCLKGKVNSNKEWFTASLSLLSEACPRDRKWYLEDKPSANSQYLIFSYFLSLWVPFRLDSTDAWQSFFSFLCSLEPCGWNRGGTHTREPCCP